MMLHKIFHMNESADDARHSLMNITAYRHQLDGVERADFNGHGTSDWSVLLPLGFKADFTLIQQDTVDRRSVVFKSAKGDFDITGIVKFHQIKSRFTEVEIMVSYESSSRAFNLLDRMFNLGDYFLLNQLRRVRAHFEGRTVPSVVRPVAFYPQPEHLKAA